MKSALSIALLGKEIRLSYPVIDSDLSFTVTDVVYRVVIQHVVEDWLSLIGQVFRYLGYITTQAEIPSIFFAEYSAIVSGNRSRTYMPSSCLNCFKRGTFSKGYCPLWESSESCFILEQFFFFPNSYFSVTHFIILVFLQSNIS